MSMFLNLDWSTRKNDNTDKNNKQIFIRIKDLVVLIYVIAQFGNNN